MLVIDYLNNTIRTSQEAIQTLGIPLLGAIAKFGGKNMDYSERLIHNQPLMSPISESYRTVATNLTLSKRDEAKSIFLITSPGPAEGKSLTTANLGIALAWAGQKVLLIDADLRRPVLHQIFDRENTVGLTSLLLAEQNDEVSQSSLHVKLSQCIKPTNIEGLSLITSGFIPNNPSDILSSVQMRYWFQAIHDNVNVDYVIIDTPPVLVASDSLILATAADAEMIMVVNAGKTNRNSAVKGKEQLTLTGKHLKGVILNAANVKDEAYYGYNYYTYYYRSENGKNGSATSRLGRLLNRTKDSELT